MIFSQKQIILFSVIFEKILLQQYIDLQQLGLIHSGEMCMIKLFFITIFYCTTISLALGKAEFATLKWQTSDNQFKKLFDTNIGAVYELKVHDNGATRYVSSEPIALLGVSLVDKKQKIRRYIFLDFTLRMFPALDRVKISDGLLFGVFSKMKPFAIKCNESIHSSFNLINKGTSRYPTLYSKFIDIDSDMKYIDLDNKKTFIEKYYPNNFRIVIDLTQYGFFLQEINDVKAQYDLVLERKKKLNEDFTTFGIILERNHDSRNARTLIELSDVKFYTSDNYDEIKSLLDTKATKFHYDNYQFLSENIKKSDNPDELFAYALHLLKGDDLPQGVEFLKKAIKEKHVIAMYQLGICYEYGIGVEKNINKALDSYNDAIEYGFAKAYFQYLSCYLKNRSLLFYTLQPKVMFNSHIQKIINAENLFDNSEYKLAFNALFLETNKNNVSYRKNDKLLQQQYLTLMDQNINQNFFNDNNDLLYSESYLYYLMKHLFLTKDIKLLTQVSSKSPSHQYIIENLRINAFKSTKAKDKYLYALIALYEFYEFKFYNQYSAVYEDKKRNFGDTNDLLLEKVIENLTIVCDNYNKEAQYILGREYLKLARDSTKLLANNHEQTGINLLQKAASQGFKPAQYLLLSHKAEQNISFSPEDLKQLKKLCQLKHAPSFRLLSSIQSENEKVKSLQSAIDYGDIEACNLLGNYYYKKKDLQNAKKYWTEYINRLNTLRKEDYFDLYVYTEKI